MNSRTSSNFQRYIEGFLVFLMGFSISLWKPGIYVSSGLILLYMLVMLTRDTEYRKQLFSGWVPKAAFALFVLGIVTASIHPGIPSDIAHYARKAMFLPIVAPLLVMFRSISNRRWALTGMTIALWIGCSMNLWNIDQLIDEQRITATWDVSALGLMTGLFVTLFTIFAFEETDRRLKILYSLNAAIAFVILVLSTSRGPWIGTFISVALYMIWAHRKLTLWAAIITAVTLALAWNPLKQLMPATMTNIESRAVSIFHTEETESNRIRLTLWKLATAHIKDKWQNDQAAFWLGSGTENHINEVREFFARTDSLTDQQKNGLSKWDYPGNDLHNMYLDTTAKMGMIWSPLIFLFLLALGWSCFKKSRPTNRFPLAGAFLMMNFLVVGFFYDIMLHFGTFFLVYFVTFAAESGPLPQSTTSLRQA